MEHIRPREREESYTSPQPSIHHLPSSGTSSPTPPGVRQFHSRGLHHHRPQTPPFPIFPEIPPSGTHKTRGKQAHKYDPKTKTSRQGYTRFPPHLQEELEYENYRPRSRARSDSNDSSALPAILRLLAHETARADAAEHELARDAEALLMRMKDAKEAKERSELELSRVREELGLYKLQLGAAQKEINRAQVIVTEVERARVEAEDRNVRDRDRIRRLINERAVEIAREEGRREGLKQGLERGRLVALSAMEGREGQISYRGEEYSYYHSDPSSSPEGSRSSGSTTRIRDAQRETDRRTWDAPTGPQVMPPLSAPIPIRPGVQQASRRQVQNSAPVEAPIHSPEDISIQGRPFSHPRQTRSVSQARASSPSETSYSRSRTRSPSLAPSRRSHRSIVVPPDGYIPTLGPDALITLPPPHELSQPVEFDVERGDQNRVMNESTNRADATAPVNEAKKDRRDTKGNMGSSGERSNVPRVRDYAYQSTPQTRGIDMPEYDDVFRERRRAAMSATSRGSTRISQYDLVGPPRPRERENDRMSQRSNTYNAESVTSGRARHNSSRQAGPSRAGRTKPEQIVEEWRSANSDIIGTPTPTNGEISQVENRVAAYPMMGTTKEGSRVHGIGTGLHSMRPSRASDRPPPPRAATPTTPTVNYIYRDGGLPENHQNSASYMPIRPPTLHSQRAGTTRPIDALQRGVSSNTVIGIEVEPPSCSPTNSSGTVVDPILLTPDHANRPTTLPHNMVSQQQEGLSGDRHEDQSVAIVWPDTDFPPGFVPLSPIPAMTNFNHADHDHNRMHEQFQDNGYQIYAGAALIPQPTMGGAPRTVASPGPSSVLFSESRRSDSRAGPSPMPRARDSARRDHGVSPATLNRPLSIFSDT